jgi:lipopolysaccharide export system protein LptA
MSGMKRLIPLMLLAVLGPASAYGQVSALKGHNSDAPIDVASDRIEVQDRADRAIFSGNVVVRQGDLTLAAPRITVAYSSAGGIQVRRVDASGGVTVKSPSETASGNVGIYDTEARLITLIGDVRLVQKDAKVNGGRLTIDLDSGRAVMDGGGPPGTTRQGGRVTGTFTMPPRKTS